MLWILIKWFFQKNNPENNQLSLDVRPDVHKRVFSINLWLYGRKLTKFNYVLEIEWILLKGIKWIYIWPIKLLLTEHTIVVLTADNASNTTYYGCFPHNMDGSHTSSTREQDIYSHHIFIIIKTWRHNKLPNLILPSLSVRWCFNITAQHNNNNNILIHNIWKCKTFITCSLIGIIIQ